MVFICGPSRFPFPLKIARKGYFFGRRKRSKGYFFVFSKLIMGCHKYIFEMSIAECLKAAINVGLTYDVAFATPLTDEHKKMYFDVKDNELVFENGEKLEFGTWFIGFKFHENKIKKELCLIPRTEDLFIMVWNTNILDEKECEPIENPSPVIFLRKILELMRGKAQDSTTEFKKQKNIDEPTTENITEDITEDITESTTEPANKSVNLITDIFQTHFPQIIYEDSTKNKTNRLVRRASF